MLSVGSHGLGSRVGCVAAMAARMRCLNAEDARDAEDVEGGKPRGIHPWSVLPFLVV